MSTIGFIGLGNMGLPMAVSAFSTQQATPMATQALVLYEQYVQAGGDGRDFSGIIRYIDALQRR